MVFRFTDRVMLTVRLVFFLPAVIGEYNELDLDCLLCYGMG
jgi:hypothetical protein